jgi:hypothetical protein
MNKLLLLTASIILLINPGKTFSQGYFDNNPVWVVHSSCAEFSTASCISQNSYYYFINGDTVINAHLYHKLYKQGYGYYTWLNSPPPVPGCIGSFAIGSSSVYYKLIRDTLRTILMLDGSNEICIYNFNLQPGDLLDNVGCYGTTGLVVDSIDTVIINGNLRERYYLSGSGASEMIEGMGHNWDFLGSIGTHLECAEMLVCYSVNNVAYYPSGASVCTLPTGIDEIENDIKVYPSPAADKFFIQSSQKINSINIFDNTGRLILNENVQDDNVWEVDVLNFPAGFYYLKIRTKPDNVQLRKIVIE